MLGSGYTSASITADSTTPCGKVAGGVRGKLLLTWYPINVVLATKEGLKSSSSRESKEILIQQDNGNSVLIDGSRITLNHHGDVSITAQGAVNITAQNPVRLTAPEVDVMGNLSVMGNLTLTNPISGQPGAVIGDISVQGKVTSSGEGIFAGHSVSTHVHSGVQSGASNTGTPIG
jgi:phage baseplate assembly protein gpV